jgi:hypothetical protein
MWLLRIKGSEDVGKNCLYSFEPRSSYTTTPALDLMMVSKHELTLDGRESLARIGESRGRPRIDRRENLGPQKMARW